MSKSFIATVTQISAFSFLRGPVQEGECLEQEQWKCKTLPGSSAGNQRRRQMASSEFLANLQHFIIIGYLQSPQYAGRYTGLGKGGVLVWAPVHRWGSSSSGRPCTCLAQSLLASEWQSQTLNPGSIQAQSLCPHSVTQWPSDVRPAWSPWLLAAPGGLLLVAWMPGPRSGPMTARRVSAAARHCSWTSQSPGKLYKNVDS